MDPDAVKRSLEMEDKAKAAFISKLPDHFYDQFLLHGLRIDAVEIGRILFSLSVTPSLCSVSSSFQLDTDYKFDYVMVLCFAIKLILDTDSPQFVHLSPILPSIVQLSRKPIIKRDIDFVTVLEKKKNNINLYCFYFLTYKAELRRLHPWRIYCING